MSLTNSLPVLAAAKPVTAASTLTLPSQRRGHRRVIGLCWIVLVTLIALVLPIPAAASSGGISGFSGKSGSTCTSCHSSGTAPTITLSGPTTVTSGSTNTYTLSVSTVTAGNGGLDVAASAGTFAAGTGTKVLSGEITHTSPSSTHSWTFSWTAPTVTSSTTATLYAAAIDSFSGGTGKLQQAITVNAAAPAPTIAVSPTSLAFNYQSGGTLPSAQTFSVSSSGSTFNYTVSTSATWLTASPTSGSTPGTVSVSVNPQSLAAGTYTGTVSISSSTASNSPKTVAITLNVTAAALPTLSVSPASLTFNYQIGGSALAAQTVALSSSGSAVNFTTATSATWLSASPASGNTPGTVSVGVNPSGLAAGTYTGTVTLSSAGASNSPKVAVTLNVTAASSNNLTVSPASLSFNYQSGGTTPAAQMVNLSSSSALSYSITTSGGWLSATPTSGSTPASLSVSVNPSGLAAGSYSGTVTVSATGASNTPQKVTVNLTVTAAPSTNPSLNISPGTLAFTYASGSSSSGTQNLSITSTGSVLNLSVAASGGSWLTVTPSSGSTPATVKVTANASGMAAGTYNGTITITSSGAANSPQKVPVQLVVSSSGGGTGRLRIWPSRGLYFDYEAGHADPAPRTVRVFSSGSPLGFTAAAHGGTWISVTPSGGMTPGSLSISVDPTGLASGTYSGTINIAAPGALAVNLPVTLRVAAGDDGGGDDGEDSTNTSGDRIRAWPYAYDPASTNTVAATWMDSTGVATASTTNTTDTRNQGLMLSKTSAASNQAQAGVVLREVDGMSLTELGYDLRSGSQCTATSPRFVVVTSDDVVHKIGCAAATTQPAPVTGWKRLRFDPANPSQTVPAIAPGSKVKTMHLVLDGGPENGASMVVLDNIDINGKFIGQQ